VVFALNIENTKAHLVSQSTHKVGCHGQYVSMRQRELDPPTASTSRYFSIKEGVEVGRSYCVEDARPDAAIKGAETESYQREGD
jgi:hypothetical protein